MNQQPSILPVETEATPNQDANGYSAPEIFEVGQTVDLIQGAQWRGPLDHPNSWPVWSL